MKKFIIVLWCVLLAGVMTVGAAPSIQSYNETYTMAADGSGKVSTQVSLKDLVAGTVDVPITTWKGVQNVKWEEVPNGVQVQPVLKGTAPCLRLTVPQGAPTSFKMIFDFDVPAPKADDKAKEPLTKEKTLNFRFLNSSQTPVSGYSLKLLLPEGNLVRTVAEKTPKGKGGQGAQAQYISEENRHGLVLSAKNINFGDVASVKLIAVPQEKSPVLIILLGAIAIIYLIGFRDIVKKSA